MRDIISGKYIDRESFVHNLDPRGKIMLLLAFIIYLLVWHSYWGYGIGFLILIAVTLIARIPGHTAIGFLCGTRFFILIAFTVHLLFTPGEGGYDWWIFHISLDGAANGFLYSLRLLELVWAAALLGWTTTPVSLSDAFEKMVGPLGKLRVPVRDIATMLLLAIRFLPTMLNEASEIKLAQKSRGISREGRKTGNRIPSLIPFIVPLFVAAFRRSDATATALVVRGYRSEGTRTRLQPLQFRANDIPVSYTHLTLPTN